MRQRLNSRKLFIGILILILGLLSCVMLASVAPLEAPGQIAFLCAGLLLYAAVQYVPQQTFKTVTPLVGGVTVVLLAITLAMGKMSHGAIRWLPIGPFHLQVSEFAKPILALVLSAYVVRYPLMTHRRLLGYFIVSGVFILPVFLQPDLGSSLVLSVIAGCILFLSVNKLRLLIPWILAGLFIMVGIWNAVLYDYQRDRITSFFSGQGNAAYNAQQAFITVGSGKLFGRGLGHGVQSQLRFLPEFHTDFFIASLAEELGLVGVIVTLLLYIALFSQLIVLSDKTDSFVRLALWGMVCALFFQMAVNIGMNMKLFPITGIPLPFLSSGGSSFLSLCIGLGVLVRLSDAWDGPWRS